MKYYCYLFLLISTLSLSAQDNWHPLFKNENLNDFQQLNGTANFEFKDGILTGTTKRNTPNSFLATKKTYSDFILEFKVKIEYGMNSGVQFRSETVDGKTEGRVFGYQAEIETSSRKWAGGIYDESRRGWLYPLTRNKKGQDAFVNGTWNHYRIEAIGNHIKTWVNGVACANLVDDMTAEGFIAFQVHDIGRDGVEGQKVQWKEVRILTKGVAAARIQEEKESVEISYLNNQLTEQEIRRGWRLLWDGETKKIESQNKNDLYSLEQFSNFELSFDFKFSEGASGGVKYLVASYLNEGEDLLTGLEFQIIDDKNHPDAKKGTKGNRSLGALYDLIPPRNLSEVNRESKRYNRTQYNRGRIIVNNGKVEHWLNEIKIVSYDLDAQAFDALISHSEFAAISEFGKQKKGHVLLEAQDGSISFKNVKIREF